MIGYAADRLRDLAHAILQADRLRRWEQSDDLLQQTLLRLNRRLDTCQVDNVQAFLRLAALEMRRALIDFARHYFGPQGLGTHHDSRDYESSGRALRVFDCSDTTRASRHDQIRHLYEAMDDLAEDEKEVVDLLWIHGLSQVDAAALLGVSTKTIARRWARARLQLHKNLNEDASQNRL